MFRRLCARRTVAALVLAGASCAAPTDLCGCSLTPPAVVAEGRVFSASGAPSTRGSVRADVWRHGCSERSAESPMSEDRWTVQGDGRYRLWAWKPGAPGTGCLRLTAVDSSAAALDSATAELTVTFSIPADTVRVDLVVQ